MSRDTKPHIIVIGAGIVGAAIAYYLSKSGATVTVIAARQGKECATGASFAWINATLGNPEPYFQLRLASIEEWHHLEDEIGDLDISWSGSILWEGLDPGQLASFVQEHRSWGYKIDQIDRGEIAVLEPHLTTPPPFAALARQEGAIDPVRTTDALLAAACLAGARLQTGLEVLEIAMEDGRIKGVRTAKGDIGASHIVVSAGTNTAKLLEPLGFILPMDNRDGLLIHTRPLPPVLNHILIGHDLDLRQDFSGCIMAGSSFGGTPLTDDPDRLAAGLIERIEEILTMDEDLQLDHWTIGCRPMPADTFPAVGPVPLMEGLYTAVTHSGITLAPIIGRSLAQEILTGEPEPLLALYRPARFS